jgi:hypothetical protein
LLTDGEPEELLGSPNEPPGGVHRDLADQVPPVFLRVAGGNAGQALRLAKERQEVPARLPESDERVGLNISPPGNIAVKKWPESGHTLGRARFYQPDRSESTMHLIIEFRGPLKRFRVRLRRREVLNAQLICLGLAQGLATKANRSALAIAISELDALSAVGITDNACHFSPALILTIRFTIAKRQQRFAGDTLAGRAGCDQHHRLHGADFLRPICGFGACLVVFPIRSDHVASILH